MAHSSDSEDSEPILDDKESIRNTRLARRANAAKRDRRKAWQEETQDNWN